MLTKFRALRDVPQIQKHPRYSPTPTPAPASKSPHPGRAGAGPPKEKLKLDENMIIGQGEPCPKASLRPSPWDTAARGPPLSL